MAAPVGNAFSSLANTLSSVPSPKHYSSGGPRTEPPGTINALFFNAVEKFALPNALMFKRGGEWQSLSHARILERVRHAAFGLAKLGVTPGDRVAILSENRPEWSIADYACLCSGVIDVPIYPTLPTEQLPYLLTNAGVKAVFVSTAEQARRLVELRPTVPDVQWIIGFEATKDDGCDMTLLELEALGAEQDSEDAAAHFKQDALAIEPDHLITLIYTSGTTGKPKGVMLTHDNVYSNCMATQQSIPLVGNDVALSFLPLSHSFERTGDYFLFGNGAVIAFAESIESVPANMQEVRPTLMLAVPRLYEKIYARVLENASAAGGLKARMFYWARGVGDRWATAKLAGEEPSATLAWQYALAQKFVFSKLQTLTGGRLRFFVSGGAPLSPVINKFFYSAGLIILEGYGLTETSPVMTANTLENFRIGTVGKPLRGVEVRIAEDGEILTRGPNVMQGYYKNPEATAAAIDEAGWFHTGDIGELDDGFLRITDRKKDIIVTAGGKNLAPQPIENKVRANKFVSQAVMIGDKRKYAIMLVVPNWDQLSKWARSQGITSTERSELVTLTAVQEKMEQEVKRELTGLGSYEMPKKVGVLEHDFTIESGELTPKLSVKRRVVEQLHKDMIEKMYA